MTVKRRLRRLEASHAKGRPNLPVIRVIIGDASDDDIFPDPVRVRVLDDDDLAADDR